MDSGQSALASTSVTIVKRAPSLLFLGSPLFLIAEGRLSCVEGETRGKRDFLSWRDVYPFDEARVSPLLGDAPAGGGKLGVVVPMASTLPDETGIAFSANLVNSETGANCPVPFQLVSRTRQGNAVTSFLEFPLDQVPEGKYFLYIHAGDKTTGALASTRASLVVRR